MAKLWLKISPIPVIPLIQGYYSHHLYKPFEDIKHLIKAGNSNHIKKKSTCDHLFYWGFSVLRTGFLFACFMWHCLFLAARHVIPSPVNFSGADLSGTDLLCVWKTNTKNRFSSATLRLQITWIKWCEHNNICFYEQWLCPT